MEVKPDEAPKPERTFDSAYGFSFAALEGGDIRLADFAGRPFMVVNTASLCGYTPQYAGLQELWTEFHGRGLMIIGVPSNDFGGQEPGTDEEIKTFCSRKYNVTFPMYGKVSVKGDDQTPLYHALYCGVKPQRLATLTTIRTLPL